MSRLPLISRSKARDTGVSRYFTGKFCPRGHIVERHTINGSCVNCKSKRQIPADRTGARAIKSLRYFTGIPCKAGHLSERFTTNAHCVVCTYTRNKSRYVYPSQAQKLDTTEIIKLYVDDELYMWQIAERTGSSVYLIGRLLRKLNVKMRVRTKKSSFSQYFRTGALGQRLSEEAISNLYTGKRYEDIRLSGEVRLKHVTHGGPLPK